MSSGQNSDQGHKYAGNLFQVLPVYILLRILRIDTQCTKQCFSVHSAQNRTESGAQSRSSHRCWGNLRKKRKSFTFCLSYFYEFSWLLIVVNYWQSLLGSWGKTFHDRTASKMGLSCWDSGWDPSVTPALALCYQPEYICGHILVILQLYLCGEMPAQCWCAAVVLWLTLYVESPIFLQIVQ